MNESKFRLNVPQSGSAARISEQQVAKPARLTVSTGSAARLSENEKRAGNTLVGGPAGFSLRAQRGQVLRKNFDAEAGITRDSEFFDRPAAAAKLEEQPESNARTTSQVYPAESTGLFTSAAQNLRRLFRT
jgi:hypothetical protein